MLLRKFSVVIGCKSAARISSLDCNMLGRLVKLDWKIEGQNFLKYVL